MGAFEGPNLNKMFYKFSESESSRLNRGVRGRLVDHCKYLIRSGRLQGFDAYSIYEQTKELPYHETYHEQSDQGNW